MNEFKIEKNCGWDEVCGVRQFIDFLLSLLHFFHLLLLLISFHLCSHLSFILSLMLALSLYVHNVDADDNDNDDNNEIKY